MDGPDLEVASFAGSLHERTAASEARIHELCGRTSIWGGRSAGRRAERLDLVRGQLQPGQGVFAES